MEPTRPGSPAPMPPALQGPENDTPTTVKTGVASGEAPPGKPVVDRKAAIEAVEQNRVHAFSAVQGIVIDTFKELFELLRSTEKDDQALKLLNAPMCGNTDKRGRHGLSFAAFNEFEGLADWLLKQGADIHAGDKDNATVLKMALINKNLKMVSWALANGADPHMRSGAKKDSYLTGFLNWKLPLPFMKLARDFNVRPENEAQREKILAKLLEMRSEAKERASDYKSVIAYFRRVQCLEGNIPEAKNAQAVDVDMQDAIDSALVNQLSSGQLSLESMLEFFQAADKRFLDFLTFNGFPKTLSYCLEVSAPQKRREMILAVNSSGNNLIFSALKSHNPEVVEAVLKYATADDLNQMTEGHQAYYSFNRNATPLSIAIAWGSPSDVLKALLAKGMKTDQPCKDQLLPGEYLKLMREEGYIKTDAERDRIAEALELSL